MNNNKGQTSVEYIMMVIAVLAMMFSAFRIVKERMLADQGNCTPASKSMICQFENIWSGKLGGGEGPCQFQFRCYPIR